MQLLATSDYGKKFHRVKTRVRGRRWDVSFCGTAVSNERLLDVPQRDICVICDSYPGQRQFPLTAVTVPAGQHQLRRDARREQRERVYSHAQ